MSDTAITGGTPSTPGFPANQVGMIPAATYPAGTPVYVSGDRTVTQAADTSAAAAQWVGLLPIPSVAGASNVPVQWAGPLSLTEAEWNAVISDATPTGLTPGAIYYVSTAGKITKVAPSAGGANTQAIGVALSPLTLLIMPKALIPVTH